MPYKTGKRNRVSRKRVNRKVRSKAIRRRTKKGGMGKVMRSVGSTLGKGLKTGAKKSFELSKKGIVAAKNKAIEHDLAGKTKSAFKELGKGTVKFGQKGLQATSSAAQVALKKGVEGTGKALEATGKGVIDTAKAGYQGFKQDPNALEGSVAEEAAPAEAAPAEAAPAAGGSKRRRRGRRSNRKSKKGGNGCGSGTVVPTGGSKRRRGRRTNRKSKKGGNGCGTGKRGGYGKVTRGGNGCGTGKRGGNHCMNHTKKRGGHGHAIHKKK